MPPNDRPAFSLGAGFLRHALTQPRLPALHIEGCSFSYGEIHRMASVIQAQIPINAHRVGIYCEEKVSTYAALLAVVLAGKCYVPLNSAYPPQRLSRIAQLSGVQAVITSSPPSQPLPVETVVIDPTREAEPIAVSLNAETAYILFTSGTTGEPKGVPVSTANLESFFRFVHHQYAFSQDDRFLQPYELSFDVSVFAMFAAWNVGACVYAVPQSGFRYMNIMKVLTDHRITVSSMVPSVLVYAEKFLDELMFPDLRYSFFSGDRLFHRLAAKWSNVTPHARLINSYGPTETTIVCTAYEWEEKKSERESLHGVVPIGTPFDGMEYLIRDSDGQIRTEGPGELCLSGPQVIAGYLDSVRESKFFAYQEKRFYRTGDVTSLTGSNTLVFHGRIDSQVKIDGYRVETGEIEHVLSQLSGQRMAVSPVSENGTTYLVAFHDQVCDTHAIHKSLAGKLPAYMLPREYVRINRFPVNLNDKIDHHELIRLYHGRNSH
jgi:D-alanine--poly(phosphoribitol) ligase subunit 1